MYLSRMAVIAGVISMSIGFSAVSAAEEKKSDPLAECYQTIGDMPRTKLAGCLDKKLSAAERKQNLREAFQITERMDGLSILVMDDVYTTGSTIEAMAHVLKGAGADRVFFVTLCMGWI